MVREMGERRMLGPVILPSLWQARQSILGALNFVLQRALGR